MTTNWTIEPFEAMKGLTLKRVAIDPKEQEIHFYSECGRHFCSWHEQDCCESVTIEDICGDLDWLIGAPLVTCEERTNQEINSQHGNDSETWTFYEMATIKGSVTIRWFGTSNGYYSESVDFKEYHE